jgi:hypothetical protein
MLPPPAPMVLISMMGIFRGKGPIFASLVISGWRSRTRQMSALVPPTSMEMMLENPAE